MYIHFILNNQISGNYRKYYIIISRRKTEKYKRFHRKILWLQEEHKIVLLVYS
jgi:hypothetical protein